MPDTEACKKGALNRVAYKIVDPPDGVARCHT